MKHVHEFQEVIPLVPECCTNNELKLSAYIPSGSTVLKNCPWRSGSSMNMFILAGVDILFIEGRDTICDMYDRESFLMVSRGVLKWKIVLDTFSSLQCRKGIPA